MECDSRLRASQCSLCVWVLGMCVRVCASANQHNYSLKQTTLHCLCTNELMRLQSEGMEGGGKAIPSLVVYCRPPRKMSCHPILMATGSFTSARINIWLQGLMSEWESRAKSLSCDRIWRKEGSKERKKEVDKEMWWHLLADSSLYSHSLFTTGHSRKKSKAIWHIMMVVNGDWWCALCLNPHCGKWVTIRCYALIEDYYHMWL